jgi:hypothetical protein
MNVPEDNPPSESSSNKNDLLLSLLIESSKKVVKSVSVSKGIPPSESSSNKNDLLLSLLLIESSKKKKGMKTLSTQELTKIIKGNFEELDANNKAKFQTLKTFPEALKKYDKDYNHRLSKKELSSEIPALVFDAMNADKDTSVNRPEYLVSRQVSNRYSKDQEQKKKLYIFDTFSKAFLKLGQHNIDNDLTNKNIITWKNANEVPELKTFLKDLNKENNTDHTWEFLGEFDQDKQNIESDDNYTIVEDTFEQFKIKDNSGDYENSDGYITEKLETEITGIISHITVLKDQEKYKNNKLLDFKVAEFINYVEEILKKNNITETEREKIKEKLQQIKKTPI